MKATFSIRRRVWVATGLMLSPRAEPSLTTGKEGVQ